MAKLNLKIFLPIFIIAAGVGGVLLLGVLKPAPLEEETQAPVLTVKVAPAEAVVRSVSSVFQGEVRAKTDIELITQVAGKIVTVSDQFVEGGAFEAGEVLLRIDDGDYLAALKSAQAAVASAKVDLELERGTAANNARQWELLQGRPVSEANPLTLNKPQVDRAQARLDAAKAELAQAQLNYDRTYLSAPFAGRITAKHAELGQFVSRGASLGRVFSSEQMEIRLPMTDVQVSELGISLGYSMQAEAKTVAERIPAEVSTVFGLDRHSWQGFLRNVDANIDNATRLVYATIVVDKPFETTTGSALPLVPGLFVDVELSAAKQVAGVQIPRMSIRNGNEVYVSVDGLLQKRSVKIIYSSEDIAIADPQQSELRAGEVVITSPVPGAFSGMAVATDGLIDARDIAAPEASPSSKTPSDDAADSIASTGK